MLIMPGCCVCAVRFKCFADIPLKDLFLPTCESLLDVVFQYHMVTFLKTNLLIKRLNINVIHLCILYS